MKHKFLIVRCWLIEVLHAVFTVLSEESEMWLKKAFEMKAKYENKAGIENTYL